MGAITGIYSPGGQPEDDGVAMLSAVAHRGRAGRVWSDGRIMLGQAGGTASDAAVVRHEPTGVTVVADARIDNAEALGLVPAERATVSVGHVILRAYLRWGERCANELVGDFAFAVWDPRLGTLLLARDPMGVKPLYCYRDAKSFAFATDPRALLRLPGVDRSLDEEQVGLFVLWAGADRRRTMYRRIFRVPGGHTLRVNDNGVHEREYWVPGSDPEVRLGSADAYAEAFREVFFEAVRVRVGETSPVAAALSGGLDSSSIVCAARELCRAGEAPAVATFSMVFPDLPEADLKRIDERAYVEAVVRDGGLDAHMIRGDELSPLGSLDDVLSALAEPHYAPNLYLHWGMYHAASERGAEVFLDGFDGDSAVSHGIGRLGSLATRQAWDEFETEVRAFAQHRGISPASVLSHYGLPQLSELASRGHWVRWASAFGQLTRRFQTSRLELLKERGVEPVVARLRGRRRGVRTDGSDVVRPELLKRIEHRLREDPAAALDPELERSSHVRSLSQAGYQLTLELADQAAAAFGLSARYPYFDRRLIALCLSIPAEYKFAGGWTRLTMRRALKGTVPEPVLWRMTKSNLSPNFYRGLWADRKVIAETDLDVLQPYIDVRKLDQKRRQYCQGANERNDGDAMLLFRTTVLARWLDRQQTETRATEPPRARAAKPRIERLHALRH